MKIKAGEILGETLDYSDIGLLVRAFGVDEKLYAPGDWIEGILGDGDIFETSFLGTVVRTLPAPDGWRYGVSLTQLGEEAGGYQ
jgi:hypothetical protein